MNLLHRFRAFPAPSDVFGKTHNYTYITPSELGDKDPNLREPSPKKINIRNFLYNLQG